MPQQQPAKVPHRATTATTLARLPHPRQGKEKRPRPQRLEKKPEALGRQQNEPQEQGQRQYDLDGDDKARYVV